MGARFKATPVTLDGIKFSSKKEAKRYAELALSQRAGLISNLECQPAFQVFIDGKHYCTYRADFRYQDDTGRTVIEEVKSSGTRLDTAYRLRRKAAEIFHQIKVTEVVS